MDGLSGGASWAPQEADPAGTGHAELAAPPGGSRLRLIGTIVLLVGIIGGSGAAGWWIRGWLRPEPEPPATIVVDRPINVIGDDGPDGVMPGLIGVSEADARQAIYDLGVSGDRLEVITAPAAGQPGLVLRQSPAAGTAIDDDDDKVSLTITGPAVVPAVIGAKEADARKQLADLGARVLSERVFDPQQPEGTVLSVEPAVGQPLVDQVTITVAAPPSSVYATEIDTVERDCSTGSVTASAVTYTQAFTCSVRSGASRPTAVEWALNREISTFEVVLSQDDRGDTGSTVTARVFLDGRLAKEATAAFGQAVTMSVPAAGALRLRIEVVVAGGSDRSASAVLGDPKFIGSAAAVDRLVEASGR